MSLFDLLPEEIFTVELFPRVDRSMLLIASMVSRLWRRAALKNAIIITKKTMKRVCCSGDRLSLLLFKEWNKELLNRGAYEAARQGDKELVTWFYQRGATDTYRTLMGACLSGNLDLAKYIHAKRGWIDRDLIQFCLWGACRGGHLPVLNWLPELKYYDDHHYYKWYLSLIHKHSYRLGHREILIWVSQKRAACGQTAR